MRKKGPDLGISFKPWCIQRGSLSVWRILQKGRTLERLRKPLGAICCYTILVDISEVCIHLLHSLNCTFSFWTLNLDVCYKSKPVDFLLCWKMYLEEGMSEALFVWSMWDLAFHMLLKLLLHWFTLRSCFRTLEEVCSNFMAFLRHYRLCSWFLPDLLVLQPFVSGQSNA